MSLKALFENGALPLLVMFDLDGTLVDSVPDLADAIDRMLADLGRNPVGEAQVRTWVGNGQWALVERALAATAPQETLDEVTLNSAVARFRHHYAACCSDKTRLFDGVRALLEYLHQAEVTMVVVTNKPKEFVPAILQRLNIAEYFSSVLGGECLTEKKPHPLPLLHCLSAYGVEPAQALMVGDSANDMLAAARAGVPSIAVSYGYAHGEDLSGYNPKAVVATLASLL